MKLNHLLALFSVAMQFLTPNETRAQWLTADEAAAIAQSSLQSSPASSPARDIAPPTLAFTMQAQGHNTLYVFDLAPDGGSVIVGGYEGVGILGITDCGQFDLSDVPPALRQLLDAYSEEISLASGDLRSPVRTSVSQAKSNIDHLVKTHWDQLAPYNALCPTDCYVGCDAVCMAQIMKYYNYPIRGTGAKGTVNFATTTYQWSKMLYDYEGIKYSDESVSAVATIMYHAGVAAEMKYGTTASSSSLSLSLKGMKTNFDYNPAAKLKQIKAGEDPTDTFYQQLALGYPLIARAETTEKQGHAFILDGYRDGLFGVNWGWGGHYDGYYALTDMLGYTSKMYAIFDLYPAGSYTLDNVFEKKEITITTPGTLKMKLLSKKYKELIIHGDINGADLRELRARCACVDDAYTPVAQGLEILDLTDANIVEGGVYASIISSSGTRKDYLTEANTLGSYAFYKSKLTSLRLPNSVKVMKNNAVVINPMLGYLRLPAQLEEYENQAVYVSSVAGGTEIELPAESPCRQTPEGVIYSPDYSKLCLVQGHHPKMLLHEDCHQILLSSIQDELCSIDTLIILQPEPVMSEQIGNAKVVWLGPTLQKLNLSRSDVNRTLFLTSPEMVKLSTLNLYATAFRSVFVPRKLLQQYISDPVWSAFRSKLRAIEDAYIVMDSCHLFPLSDRTLMLGMPTSLGPLQVLDTQLFSVKPTWKSSKTSVATVNEAGEVIPCGIGTAKITCKVGSYSTACKVTVCDWPEVIVSKPGELAAVTQGKTYEYLRIKGALNGEDLRQIRYLCGADDVESGYFKSVNDNPTLRYLDLKQANFVAGGGYIAIDGTYSSLNYDNRLPYNSFCRSELRYLMLPSSMDYVSRNSMYYNNYLYFIELPESIDCINPDLCMRSDLQTVVYRGENLLKFSSSDEATQFQNATLYVHSNLLKSFKSNVGSYFKAIEPLESLGADYCGIEEVSTDRITNQRSTFYSLFGQPLTTPGKGIRVIDGKTVLIR